MEKEIGKVVFSDKTAVHIRIDEYKGRKGVTIRKFIESDKYTGFTKQGLRVPIERWADFKAVIDKVDGELKQ
ncbi:MAG: PC4/YdbC family ssDNA-binding protein [Candidatus Woesearchaeota archaeon]